MKHRTELLLWAQRVIARKGQPPHVLLEIAEDATPQQIQAAFHQIARTSHPDLYRRGLDAAELELVTSAYAAVAGAYQELRTRTKPTVRMVPLRREDGQPITPPSGLPVTPGSASSAPAATPSGPPAVAAPPPPPAASGTPPAGVATTSTPPRGTRSVSPTSPPPITSAQPAASSPPAPAMSPKAVIYYRKAELCLKRGDLKGAVLQLKLAIAQDPSSSFLRTALAEVETEVRKPT